MKKLKHGGKRKGAGAHKKYGEETKTITYRIPLSLIEPIKNYIQKALAKKLKQNNRRMFKVTPVKIEIKKKK